MQLTQRIAFCSFWNHTASFKTCAARHPVLVHCTAHGDAHSIATAIVSPLENAVLAEAISWPAEIAYMTEFIHHAIPPIGIHAFTMDEWHAVVAPSMHRREGALHVVRGSYRKGLQRSETVISITIDSYIHACGDTYRYADEAKYTRVQTDVSAHAIVRCRDSDGDNAIDAASKASRATVTGTYGDRQARAATITWYNLKHTRGHTQEQTPDIYIYIYIYMLTPIAHIETLCRHRDICESIHSLTDKQTYRDL